MRYNKLYRHLILAVLLALVSLAGAQTKISASNAKLSVSSSVANPHVEQNEDYTIGVDDILAINVWKETELTRTETVRPDGRITLPLVGDVEASGFTPKELQARLEKSLENYISKPVVTVIVQEAKSQTFNVLGEVQKQGPYRLTAPTTVLDAIALAGGFKEWANKGKIYVLRKTKDGGSERLPFNYKKAIKGDSEQNFRLQARDTVIVP